MGYEPYVNTPSRYARTFQSLNPAAFIGNFFMLANTTGVAGDLMKYSSEDTVTLTTSGVAAYQIAGFLMQDVKDLDAGSVKGYRSPFNTVEHLGGSVGILQQNGPALTKRYVGSPAVGARLQAAPLAGDTGKLATYAALNTGDPIAVVEAVTSSDTPTVEPAQFSGTAAPDFIRIRIYGL